MTALPFRSSLEAYEQQAQQLLEGWCAADPEAVADFNRNHPRFLDETITWLPRELSESDRQSALNLEDARLAVARSYSFQDWNSLAEWVNAVREEGSPVARFEEAVEAVISGDEETLKRLLRAYPELVRARSSLPHRATLLHYVAANGTEGYRQKSPKNAVAIAKILLEAGAEPDALADMYDGQCTTMCMLVSSCHPANAGVQVPLVEVLLDHGADVEGRGSGAWWSPLHTALAFGYSEAAEVLARRGARVETLAAAAGLGLLAEARRLLPAADELDRHRALALAAQHGRAEVLRMLLEAGEDPNRFNPQGNHGHSTPLHQAALSGHFEVVRLLVERGARVDIRDTVHRGTASGWAEHGGQLEIAAYLRDRAAAA